MRLCQLSSGLGHLRQPPGDPLGPLGPTLDPGGLPGEFDGALVFGNTLLGAGNSAVVLQQELEVVRDRVTSIYFS